MQACRQTQKNFPSQMFDYEFQTSAAMGKKWECGSAGCGSDNG